ATFFPPLPPPNEIIIDTQDKEAKDKDVNEHIKVKQEPFDQQTINSTICGIERGNNSETTGE
ncbi:MAG: hypothetical protein ACK44G_07135, partial [Aphanizomenon sp.]